MNFGSPFFRPIYTLYAPIPISIDFIHCFSLYLFTWMFSVLEFFFLVSRVFFCLFVITHIHCYIWNKLIDSILTFLSPLWFFFVFQTNVEGGRCFVLNFEAQWRNEKILPMEIFIRISDRFDSLFTANILFTVYFRCYSLHKYSQCVIYMYQRRHTPKKKHRKNTVMVLKLNNKRRRLSEFFIFCNIFTQYTTEWKP